MESSQSLSREMTINCERLISRMETECKQEGSLAVLQTSPPLCKAGEI